MEHLEQENQALREQVTNMKGEIERLTAIVTGILATQAQAQVSVPPLTSTSLIQPTTMLSSTSLVQPTTVLTSLSQLTRPEGCTWGMLQHMPSGGFCPVISEI